MSRLSLIRDECQGVSKHEHAELNVNLKKGADIKIKGASNSLPMVMVYDLRKMSLVQLKISFLR